MKHFVLGAGKMTQAIFLGLHNKLKLDATFYTPSITSAKELASLTGGNYQEEMKIPSDIDYLWLGVKPQGLGQLKDLGRSLSDKTVVVSMLAAIDEKTQCEVLGVKKLIRIMPNIPVKYNAGVVLVSSQSAMDEAKILKNLLQHLGKVLIVSEEDLEGLTLLTGSGPAFFYEFTQSLAAQFAHPEAQELAKSVLNGCAETFKQDSTSAQQLIDAVTSKGGVTIAVLEKWREEGFQVLLKKGIDAGRNRSKELNQK